MHTPRLFFSALLAALMTVVIPVAPASARPAPESFAPLVEKLMPAVVNISTTQKVAAPKVGRIPGMPAIPGMPGLPNDPQLEPFREFLERYQGQGGEGGSAPAEQEVYSLGSGFIIDPKGYVVTNNHVISEASSIKVILHDDTTLEAKVVGRDTKTDLALLKVEAKRDLPFVKLGDSNEIRVGDWVVAIGNPFGLGGTVTAGIISARSRTITAGPFDDFLQTDAAINRGNSGGPLFNVDGEVIGISTAIFSPTGGNIGIGFAVPTAMAGPIIMQLKEFGRTYRGWLGVKIQAVDEKLAESVGMKDPHGAMVIEVTPNSPAIGRDIQPGDIITEFDGTRIDEMRELPRVVAETKVGKNVPVKLWRNGETVETSVKLGELDEQEDVAENANDEDGAAEPTDIKTTRVAGMEVVTLTAPLITRFNLEKGSKGVLIVELVANSEAAKLGLRNGDIINEANFKAVGTVEDLQAAIKNAGSEKRDNVLVRIKRGNANLYITLPTQPAGKSGG